MMLGKGGRKSTNMSKIWHEKGKLESKVIAEVNFHLLPSQITGYTQKETPLLFFQARLTVLSCHHGEESPKPTGGVTSN